MKINCACLCVTQKICIQCNLLCCPFNPILLLTILNFSDLGNVFASAFVRFFLINGHINYYETIGFRVYLLHWLLIMSFHTSSSRTLPQFVEKKQILCLLVMNLLSLPMCDIYVDQCGFLQSRGSKEKCIIFLPDMKACDLTLNSLVASLVIGDS